MVTGVRWTILLVAALGGPALAQQRPPQADPATLAKVEVTAPAGAVSAGKPATVVVTVRATGTAQTPSHLEPSFPTRLKLTPPEGLTAPAQLEKGAAAKIAHEEIRFEVPVTAARPGSYALAGRIEFAVCQEDPATRATLYCVPQRRDVALTVVVK